MVVLRTAAASVTRILFHALSNGFVGGLVGGLVGSVWWVWWRAAVVSLGLDGRMIASESGMRCGDKYPYQKQNKTKEAQQHHLSFVL